MRRGVTRRGSHEKKGCRRCCNWLHGSQGDAHNAVLCGAGHNLHMILGKLWLLRTRILALLTVIGELEELEWSLRAGWASGARIIQERLTIGGRVDVIDGDPKGLGQ